MGKGSGKGSGKGTVAPEEGGGDDDKKEEEAGEEKKEEGGEEKKEEGGEGEGGDDGNDPDAENPDVDDFNDVKRSCHDCLFCALFLVFWIGMIAVFWTAVKQGEPKRLLYGVDYEGNVCGVDNSDKAPEGFAGDPADLDFTNKTLLYFPIMGQMIDQTAPQDTVMFGICVEEVCAPHSLCTLPASACC